MSGVARRNLPNYDPDFGLFQYRGATYKVVGVALNDTAATTGEESVTHRSDTTEDKPPAQVNAIATGRPDGTDYDVAGDREFNSEKYKILLLSPAITPSEHIRWIVDETCGDLAEIREEWDLRLAKRKALMNLCKEPEEWNLVELELEALRNQRAKEALRAKDALVLKAPRSAEPLQHVKWVDGLLLADRRMNRNATFGGAWHYITVLELTFDAGVLVHEFDLSEKLGPLRMAMLHENNQLDGALLSLGKAGAFDFRRSCDLASRLFVHNYTPWSFLREGG